MLKEHHLDVTQSQSMQPNPALFPLQIAERPCAHGMAAPDATFEVAWRKEDAPRLVTQ